MMTAVMLVEIWNCKNLQMASLTQRLRSEVVVHEDNIRGFLGNLSADSTLENPTLAVLRGGISTISYHTRFG